MTRGVPVLLIVIGTVWAREESFLEDSRVSRLVEGCNAELLIGILLDDSEGILVGVERSHEDEGDVNLVSSIQMLDLTDCQVEESHVVLDFKSALGAGHAYSTHPWNQTNITEETEVITNPWRCQGLH